MKTVFKIAIFLSLALASFSCKKRCPIKSCQTKMVHAHGGVEGEVRGMPWWKKQNPKTGELDPVLHRDGKDY